MKKLSRSLSRRDFLKQTAIASTLPFIGCPSAIGNTEYYDVGLTIGQGQKQGIISFYQNVLTWVALNLVLSDKSIKSEASELESLISNFEQEHGLPNNPSQENQPSVEKANTLIEKILTAMIFSGNLENSLAQFSPNNYQKAIGIADGSLGQSFRPLVFLTQYYEIASSLDNPLFGACSALSLKPEINELNEPILAKNFDYPWWIKDLTFPRQTRPKDKLSSLDISVALMPGAVSTTNGQIAITQNAFWGTESFNVYLPLTCSLQDATEQCASTQETIDFLNTQRNAGYHILNLIDKDGNIALIENTPYEKFSRILPENETHLITTNHFQLGSPFGSLTQIGAIPLLSTQMRYESIRQKMNQILDVEKRKLTLEDVFQIMSNSDNGPLFSVANLATVNSAVMLPRSGKAFVCNGNPSEPERVFQEYFL